MPYTKKVMKYKRKKYSKRRPSKVSKKLNSLLKLMKTTIHSIFMGYRECNEISDGSGKQVLKLDLVTGDELPLHIYPLKNVIQGGVAPSGGFKLKANGYDFTALGDIQYMGSKGQSMVTTAAMKVRKYKLNYISFDLMLWGTANRKSEYDVYLFQFKDKDYDPNIFLTTTDTEVQDKRTLFFKRYLVRRRVTNPIIGTEVNLSDLRKDFRQIWHKQYTVGETLSTEDEHKHGQVPFFRNMQEVVSYDDSPRPATLTDANYMIADNVDTTDITDDPSCYPQTQNNMFLVIVGRCPAEDLELSYDINIKNKYSVLGNVGL